MAWSESVRVPETAYCMQGCNVSYSDGQTYQIYVTYSHKANLQLLWSDTTFSHIIHDMILNS